MIFTKTHVNFINQLNAVFIETKMSVERYDELVSIFARILNRELDELIRDISYMEPSVGEEMCEILFSNRKNRNA